MGGHRISRVNEQLKREVTLVIRDEVKDPRIGFITITGVEASGDLSTARVHVSVMGDEPEKQESVRGLQAAAPFIRGVLGKRLHLRRIPELRFELDRGLEHAMKIERLLQEVKEGDDDGEPDGTPGE